MFYRGRSGVDDTYYSNFERVSYFVGAVKIGSSHWPVNIYLVGFSVALAAVHGFFIHTS